MNIGAASKLSGVPAKTIRYYETVDLIPPATRTEAGYRDYQSNDVHILRFLKRSRTLGFTVSECRELLSLYRDDARASADVKQLALQKVGDIDQRLEELRAMRETLVTLAEKCQGNDRPNCPILNDLAGKAV
jgi:MerR family transcriptional regulator, copper efflux regulator